MTEQTKPDSKTELQEHAKIVSESLHDSEEALEAKAASLPPSEEKDELQIRGERLSDEAWRIEEEFDLDPHPSGLWPDNHEG